MSQLQARHDEDEEVLEHLTARFEHYKSQVKSYVFISAQVSQHANDASNKIGGLVQAVRSWQSGEDFVLSECELPLLGAYLQAKNVSDAEKAKLWHSPKSLIHSTISLEIL